MDTQMIVPFLSWTKAYIVYTLSAFLEGMQSSKLSMQSYYILMDH